LTERASSIYDIVSGIADPEFISGIYQLL
jgi:hypothetical protein